MKDFLKNFIYTGVGLVAETGDKLKETVDKLIDEGKISIKEGKKIADDFVDNAETKKDELEGQFEKVISKLVNNFSFADKDEIAKLEKRIVKLEKELKKTKTTVKKVVKKKTVAKTKNKSKIKPPQEGKD